MNLIDPFMVYKFLLFAELNDIIYVKYDVTTIVWFTSFSKKYLCIKTSVKYMYINVSKKVGVRQLGRSTLTGERCYPGTGSTLCWTHSKTIILILLSGWQLSLKIALFWSQCHLVNWKIVIFFYKASFKANIKIKLTLNKCWFH